MELKERLQDYTRAEFRILIEKIMRVDASEQEHNELVRHFDLVSAHPQGADLLFYPDLQDDTGHTGADRVIYAIQEWHMDSGQSAFMDDKPRQPPQPGPQLPLSAADRAVQASTANLAKVQAIAARIIEAHQNTETALTSLVAVLFATEAEPVTQPSTSDARTEFARLEGVLTNLEHALRGVTRSVYNFDSLKMTIQFAKDEATRSTTYRHLDGALQTSILQQITHTSDQYLAQHAIVSSRHRELHTRSQALISTVESRLIRLASENRMGPLKDASYFNAVLNDVDTLPQVLTTYSKISDSFTRIIPDLKNAIRSAVSGLSWSATRETGDGSAIYASILSFQFNRPGCGEPFAVSVPLSELAATEGRDWQDLAATNAEVDLPFRITSGIAKVGAGKLFEGLKEITERADVRVVATNSQHVASSVKVLAAAWDADSAEYRFSRPGNPTNTVRWVPPSSSNRTQSLDVLRERPTGPGFMNAINVPLIEPVPSYDDWIFDDCIVIFPESSEIQPVYIMFKNALEYAGAASGAGRSAGSDWLSEASASVPSQIADQLRGRIFKRFSSFTEAFWQAIGSNMELSSQLAAEDLIAVKEGKAPFPLARTGHLQDGRLEICHTLSFVEGGDIYDMDNMQIKQRTAARRTGGFDA
jgi:hypothetical protein